MYHSHSHMHTQYCVQVEWLQRECLHSHAFAMMMTVTSSQKISLFFRVVGVN